MDPRVPRVTHTELCGRPRILRGQMRGLARLFAAFVPHLCVSYVVAAYPLHVKAALSNRRQTGVRAASGTALGIEEL